MSEERAQAADGDRADRGPGRPHRAGDGPAARLTARSSRRTVTVPDQPDPALDGRPSPDLRGRSARRAPERINPRPARPSSSSSNDWLPPACARSRRRASSRRRRSRSWPTPTTCCRGSRRRRKSASRSSSRTSAAWPAPRPRARDALAVFTAATDAFTERNIGMSVDASLDAFTPVLARAATSAGGAAATSRPHSAVRIPAPWTRIGRSPSPCASWTSAWTRSASATRSGSGSRPGPALTARGRRGAGSRWSRSRSTSTTRAAPRWPTCGGLDAGVRCFDSLHRRNGRLPVRAGSRRQSRHRGSRLLPRCVRVSSTASISRACSRRRGSSRRPWARRLPRRSDRPAGGIASSGARSAAEPVPWHSIRAR